MLSCNVNSAVNLLYLIAITCSYVLHISVGAEDCVLVNKDSTSEKDILQRLTGLKGETISLEDKVGGKIRNVYEVGICTNANKSIPQAGAVQHDMVHNQTYKLGSIKATALKGGSDWIVITYKDGDKYNGTCGSGAREVHIMVTCNSTVHHGTLELVEGNTDNGTECSYLFVVGSSIVCSPPKKAEKHGLSGGSVFCILFFTVVGCYLFLGFLYKRIVVGAKGVEQIPNYKFWKDFGSLQADGCNFLCRGQCAATPEDPSYRNIDERPRRAEEDRDDQLLSM
ncbi:cation-dependent mannose-6-phosphate receptor-like [Ornithodoros turicata]|uniref:cation-dependent mannose-6-phosphate receptor-like n=1 Tax=Ornithodoros turicata TaxID=34597 RepID=UPI003139145E